MNIQNGACYIRVSTDDQTEFSPDAQLKAIKKFAKLNEIILIKDNIYIDEGISGRRADKRPAFQQMIATAKSKPKPFDVILVHKFDRFARSREDSVVYKSLLKRECDIKVISITESIEDDKFSVILEAMLEAMAEYYSLNLSEEVLKGMTEKAERGGLQTAPSLGYDVLNNMLVVNQDEAKIVRLIFDKITNREMNIRQMTVYLNDMGYKTKKGNPFQYRNLIYILNNTVYLGKLRWSPEKFKKGYMYHENPDVILRDGGHEPLIDEETFQKAKEILQENKELYGNKQKQTTQLKTWLKGLVLCSHCGKTLVQTHKHFLQCNGYAKGKCKFSCHVSYEILEKLVLSDLRETFKGKIEINVVPKKSDNITSNEYELLNLTLNKLEIREKRIKEAYQDGIDTIEEYKNNKLQLQSERTVIIERLKGLKEVLQNPDNKPIHKEIESLYSLLNDIDIDLETKHKAANFIIDNVVYNKEEKTLQITYK